MMLGSCPPCPVHLRPTINGELEVGQDAAVFQVFGVT